MTTTEVPPSADAPGTVGRDLRAPSVVAGASLAAMALLAPLGIFVALPNGDTGTAALVVLVIALLDVVVAVALLPLLRPGGVLLAQTAAALRVTYAAVFAVAGASLLPPVDEDRFHAIWDAGLLLFGAHLVLAGLAAVRGGVIPRWIGWLVVLAGAGYVVDAVLVAVAADVSLSFAAITFVGEVVLLVWLLARGGRGRQQRA